MTSCLTTKLRGLGFGSSFFLGCGFTVHLQQLVGIELGSLEHFRLADENILEGVDACAFLLDSLSKTLGDEFNNKILKIACASLLCHDIHHLLSDKVNLSSLGVRGFLDLVGSLLGEGNSEHSQNIAISGLNVNVSLNESLPFSNERAELVGGQVHAVEVAEASCANNIFYSQIDLSVSLILIFLEIGKIGLENSSLQVVRSDSLSTASCNWCLAHLSVGELDRGLDIIPILLGKWVDCLFLCSLLLS